MRISVVTFGTSADGSPGYFLTEGIEVSVDAFGDGQHYGLAAEAATAAGYVAPFVHFDEFDAAPFPWIFQSVLR